MKRLVYRAPMTKGARQLAQVFERPTQRDVAKQLRISEPHLSLLANGKRIPSMSVAARIEQELGIPVQSWAQEAQ